MIDREKVINDLQDAVNDDWMWQHADYYAKAMENAIALLKEQEAVKPKIDAFGHPYCPKCKVLVYQTWSFCPHCGQAVKWE